MNEGKVKVPYRSSVPNVHRGDVPSEADYFGNRSLEGNVGEVTLDVFLIDE